MGGKIKINYTSAPQVAGAVDASSSQYPVIVNKSPSQLVTTITHSDGLDQDSTKRYEYYRGMIYMGKPWERVDLGFSLIREINATGNYKEIYYLQNPPLYHGLIDRKITYNASGQKYREIQYNYSHDEIYPGYPDIKFIYKTDEYTYNFDGTGAPNNYRIEYKYDELGNLKELRNHGDTGILYDDIVVKTEYAYNLIDYIMVPCRVRKFSYNLDDMYGLSSEVRYYYDVSETIGNVEKGLLTIREDENGGGVGVITYGYDVVTAYGYDEYGNRIWIRDGRINNGEYDGYTVQTQYDSQYKTLVVCEKNALEQTTSTTYNSLMLPVEIEDINGQLWKTKYDTFGRVTAIISPGDDDINPTTRTTYYDAIVNENGTISRPMYIKTEIKESMDEYFENYNYYDGFGRVIQEKSGTGEGMNMKCITVDYYYNERGNNWKTSVPYITNKRSYKRRDSSVPCTYQEYDALGRVIKAYNTDGTFKEIIYGGKSTTIIDENRHVTVKEVDGNTVYKRSYKGNYPSHQLYATVSIKEAWNGTRITSINDDGNEITIETELDKLGKKVRYNDPDMGEWRYIYDANGNLISQRDAKENTIEFEYDKLNRITKKDYPTGSDTIYHYDEEGHGYAFGRLTSVTYAGGSESYSYDERGRVISETKIINGKSRILETEYDSIDRVVKHIYPDNEEVIYTYDDYGNLYSLSGNYHYVDEINYTPLGKVSYISYGNGISTIYDYYDTGWEYDYSADTYYSYRLREIITNPPDILNMCYEYDRVDNVLVKRNLNNFFYTEMYNYDDLDRLKSANSFLYGYKSYEYDRINNIIEKDGRSYVNHGDKSHAITDDGRYTYSYDANGNMVSRSDGRVIEYDYDNRIVSISDEGIFGYDSETNRISKYENGITTLYFFPQYEEDYRDGEQTPNVVKYYFANNGRIARWSTDDGLLYFHTDHLGSSVSFTDDSGELIGVFKYEPYGYEVVGYTIGEIPNNLFIEYEIIESSEEYLARDTLNTGDMVIIEREADVSFVAGEKIVLGVGLTVRNGANVHLTINPSFTEPITDIRIKYLFTGKEKDGNGFYYYGARYYDSELGGFISPDTVLDGLNRYTYCHDNPVKYVDPTGHGIIDNYIGRLRNDPELSVGNYLSDIGWDRDGGSYNQVSEGQMNGGEGDGNEINDFIWESGKTPEQIAGELLRRFTPEEIYKMLGICSNPDKVLSYKRMFGSSTPIPYVYYETIIIGLLADSLNIEIGKGPGAALLESGYSGKGFEGTLRLTVWRYPGESKISNHKLEMMVEPINEPINMITGDKPYLYEKQDRIQTKEILINKPEFMARSIADSKPTRFEMIKEFIRRFFEGF